MKKYITPDIAITHFSSENIITASETEAADATADIKNYATTGVRLKQVEFNDVMSLNK